MTKFALLVGLLALTTQPGFCAPIDTQSKKQWQDQDTWQKFVDKQNKNNSSTTPQLPIKDNANAQSSGAGKSLSGEDEQSYVLMPGTAEPARQPATQVETTVVGIPFRYGSPNRRLGLYGRQAGYGMVYHPVRRVVQTGPSRASGNYYAPTTSDHSASGNYYGSSAPTRALPIYKPQAQRDNYWGSQGNPFAQFAGAQQPQD